MGAATLINSCVTASQSWHFSTPGFVYALWGFWWLDLMISYLCAFGMLFTMMTQHEHTLAKMASIWVLPMVTLIVASSTGGLVAQALRPHSIHYALLTTSVSFSSLIIGLSLALMIITIYLSRLVLHGPPDVGLILSAFVTLGPLGQGGFSFLINGNNLSELLPLHLGTTFPQASITGTVLYTASFCASWILWSMGVAWVLISIISIYAIARKNTIPFSLGYWGLIFPNAVFALLSVQLGDVLESPFFNVFGALWSCITFALWLYIFFRSIPAVLNTSIFVAPCLAIPPGAIPEPKMEEVFSESNTSSRTATRSAV